MSVNPYGQHGPPPQLPRQQPPKKRSSAIIFVILGMAGFGLLIFVSLAVYGFTRYMERARAIASADAASAGSPAPGGRTALDATDGHSRLLLPPHWKSLPALTDKGVIRAGSNVAEEYVIVITEDKVDFADNTDIRKYGDFVIKNMRGELSDPSIDEPVALTINGRAALQYEVHGAVDLLKIAYLVTVVDGAKHYHQVIVWTKASKFTEIRAKLAATVSSFREL